MDSTGCTSGLGEIMCALPQDSAMVELVVVTDAHGATKQGRLLHWDYIPPVKGEMIRIM